MCFIVVRVLVLICVFGRCYFRGICVLVESVLFYVMFCVGLV